jgi:hypothetical protein
MSRLTCGSVFIVVLASGTLGHTRADDSPKLVLKSNQTVRIKCGEGDNARWLAGNNDEGTVSLAKKEDDPGTLWRLQVEKGGVRLCLLRDAKDPRWLDGETEQGMLKLPKDTRASGTLWGFTSVKGDVFELKSLGHIDGRRWLKANVSTGEVRLHKKSDEPDITQWQVIVVKPRGK